MIPRTQQTLDEISRHVAADNELLAGRIGPPSGRAGRGIADLFAEACGSASVSDEYCFGLEYIFEGFLLHYRPPGRLLAPDTPEFNLLAGDFMYARGLTHMAALKDAQCIRLLADLISLCAHIDSVGGRAGAAGNGRETTRAWLLTTLCLARRAVFGDEGFGEYRQQMDRYRDDIFQNYGGRDAGEVEPAGDSFSCWLKSGFPQIDLSGWFDELETLCQRDARPDAPGA